MVKKKDMAVLATVWEGKPHCSLMAYLCNDPCTEIYMVTYRHTQKYKNLAKNPLVSVLIDTRDEDMVSHRKQVKALTISGQYQPILDREKKATIRQQMLERHPHLHDIIEHKDGEIIVIHIASFLLLDGPTTAHFHKVQDVAPMS
jgi:nitroimidazol reductase NimA-like FMN-containing flavoprotein (pyridoxamine 5'-phosphate oxidase superfamily)